MQSIIIVFQKMGIRRIFIRFLLQILLVVTTISLSNEPVFAGTSNAENAAQKAEQAAEKVVQDDEAIKDRSAQPKSVQVIKKARVNAQRKLESMADNIKEKQNVDEALPPSQENFLENLQGK